MSKRAERRHHKDRMVERVKKSTWFRGLEEHRARYYADNRQPCSCSMCGNQRNSVYVRGHHRLTVQELKARVAERDQDYR